MLRPLRTYVRSGALRVIQIAAPPRCIECLAAGTWLCQPCLLQLSELPRVHMLHCPVCGKTAARGLVCRQCREDSMLTGAVSGLPFARPSIRRAVHWLKFRGLTALAPVLADFILPVLPSIAPMAQLRCEAVFVPLPLHRRRLVARGYNQSALLARALSHRSGIPCADLLLRTRATAPQTSLSPTLRGRNVAGAFALLPDSGTLPAKILVVDDVLTSGSTLMAAASAFPDAPEVWGVTAAR